MSNSINPIIDDLDIIEKWHFTKARASFVEFRRYTGGKKFKVNWFVVELTQRLEDFYSNYKAGLRPKLIIQIPPQHGKSDAVIDFIAWASGKDSDLRFIFASFSERLGIRANLKLRRIMRSRKYKLVFPDSAINEKNTVTQTEKQLNATMIEFTGAGSFRNTTVKGSVTGETLDIGIIDDPIKGRAEARSATTRNNAWDWLTDDFMTRFDEMGALLMVLTRWHIDDPAGRLISTDKGVEVFSYKAIAENDEKNRKAGEALFPAHKSIEFLESRRSILAPNNWQSLYQQNPVMDTGNMFNIESFKPIKREILDKLEFERRYITADTALKAKELNDYTVYICFGALDNKVYILDIYRGKPESIEREVTARSFYARNDVYPFSGMYIEQKASGIDLYQRLKDSLIVIEVERNIDKEIRANDVMPYVDGFGVYYADDLEHSDVMITELTTFPDGVHDDIVDCIIDGVEIAHKQKIIDYESIL